MPKSWQRTSNRDLLIGLSVLALLVAVSSFQKSVKNKLKTPDQAKTIKITIPSWKSKPVFPVITTYEPPQKGVMVAKLSNTSLYLNSTNLQSNRLTLRRFNRQTVGMVAQASDENFYYANGFFQGFVPFEVDNVYNAMNFIAQRLRYQYDEKLFGGFKEIWQTSKEAYVRMRGDCEDHAILLADWLVSMGHDARVAVGTYKGGGHAWVVWFSKGEAYIIEATNKRQRRFYPLAGSMYEYQATYMFNKKSFWEKRGKGLTDDYYTHWIKTADFKPL